MTQEVLKMALDALEYAQYSDEFGIERGDNAITAIREALAQQQEPDSTCNNTLRDQNKGYPRTCKKCGKGPCIADRVQPAQPQQEPPFSVQQAYAMAQVCLDMHDALGCKWGDNVYLTISQLIAQPQQGASLTMQDIVCPLCGDMARTWPKKENT